MRPPRVVVVLIHTWLVKVFGALSVAKLHEVVDGQLPAKIRLKSLSPRDAALSPAMAPGWFQVTPVSARPSVTPMLAGEVGPAARSVTTRPAVSLSGQ